MCCNGTRIGLGSTLAMLLTFGSMFAQADRLSAAQPSQGIEFQDKGKNITVSEGVSGLSKAER